MLSSDYVSPVHPRERGEHSRSCPGRLELPGSSPRARGTLSQSLDYWEDRRFIPASAGNTQNIPTLQLCKPVHPRERGEHEIPAGESQLELGSSPRARGTRTCVLLSSAKCRFIPASAGNTFPSIEVKPHGAVHPRERGEHPQHRTKPRSHRGSSPRARGTLGHRSHGIPCCRFIPASAGNTAGIGILGLSPAVHPRERGEHCIP